ncbi:Trm112 family protein [Aureimonas leprariae]|uniref:Trm112 family protein n=2 Tax=Plantimonas leprariae TaxID=2615207 RepID=A0A7V7PMF7_9HYPH|nr:Trm112 family protein [Aureimonas leprariae]KAB0678120.1 Trm112 family protein [Aureimonas leprariae]
MVIGKDRNGSRVTRAAFDTRALDVLICPLTRASLIYVPESDELVSRQGALAYPIRAGVAILVPSEARRLDGDDKKI